MAEFTATFTIKRVNTTDWATYRQFIESLRKRKELIFRRTRNNIPILHPEVRPPNDKYFDIVLNTSANVQVRLRIRRSNLYLVGYQNKDGHWLEFGTGSGTRQIPGSTFLGFNGNYDSLESENQNRRTLRLGLLQLQNAVIILALSTNGNDRKKALIIVIQMICESMRFKKISNHLAKKFQNESVEGKNNRAEAAPLWMRATENAWAPISEELLHIDSDPKHSFRPPDNDTGIRTATDARNAIGMLKYYRFPRRITGVQAVAADGDGVLDDDNVAAESDGRLGDGTGAADGNGGLDDDTVAAEGDGGLDDNTIAGDGAGELDDGKVAAEGDGELDIDSLLQTANDDSILMDTA